jgi:hypothetical protein
MAKENLNKLLSKEVNAIRKSSKVKIGIKEDSDKYSKAKYLEIYQGFDMLEDLYTVRTFTIKKFDIDPNLLEILLKLMGMRIFTRLEYSKIPRNFTYGRFQSILESGYVNILMDNTDVEKRLFCLNTKGRNIVITFYEHLSGQVPIPEDSKHNPMANKNKNTPYDKKKLDLIKRMNKLEVPEHKKRLFE